MVEDSEKNFVIAFYLFDETALNRNIQKIKDERFVAGLIYIDNYEEALESIDDVRRSLFIGLIDKRVNKYFASGAAIVRKLEKDKYLAVFRYKYLEKLMADRFSLLEDIKSVKIGNEMTITLSIGIGTSADGYAKNYDYAKAAMDLALGRGGDQAVVKDGEKILYYGGKSQQMEKNTRVKVRVKAHALRQILDTTDNVLIMGHKLADIDSFGSAIGIYTICRRLGKRVHIVINEVTSSVKPFMNRFIGKDEYPEDLFLLKEEAPEYVDSDTVVIVVDVNKPQLTECPQLLDLCSTIVVFDHHRQSSDQITGAVLSYVDPYASSASEMITEMIQYVDDDIKIKAFEADALYAGINIDTDGFNNKSGPRTFEAAAFLRRHGADVTRVRKMLRNDMKEYRAVAYAVSKAEVYKDAFAIAVFNGSGLESPTIGGAKAANQLLDISGIKASFVMTEYNEKIYISARSIDEVNVQLVMEKLGGGGHMTIAGAQIEGVSVHQAIERVKSVLDNMLAEGEI
jgi:c-di-AMP phosphodiesterase-like protein